VTVRDAAAPANPDRAARQCAAVPPAEPPVPTPGTRTAGEVSVSVSDSMAISDHDELSVDERRYIGAARAASTVRGYRSYWSQFATWCVGRASLPYRLGRAPSPGT
jgi:hypothetical protein